MKTESARSLGGVWASDTTSHYHCVCDPHTQLCPGVLQTKMPKTNKQTKRMPAAKAGNQKGKSGTTTTVTAPAAMSRISGGKGNGSGLRFKEKETVGQIAGALAFASGAGVTYNAPINPGLATSFPWLANIASQYDKYKVHSLTYRYVNIKGSSSPGIITISYDDDALDALPQSYLEQSQSASYKRGAPWTSFELRVPVDRAEKFVRAGVVPGTDQKTYDAGRIIVTSDACADTSVHGYLEVEYDIELFKKSTPVSGGISMGRQVSLLTVSGSMPSTAVTSATLATSGVVFTPATNPLNLIMGVGKLTLSAGTYRVTYIQQNDGDFISSIGGTCQMYCSAAGGMLGSTNVSISTTISRDSLVMDGIVSVVGSADFSFIKSATSGFLTLTGSLFVELL